MSNVVRVAIVGCGAISDFAYLPTLKGASNARVTLLIDTNAERRRDLASKFNVAHTHHNVDECYDLFDAAIVALPHNLHAPTSIKLLAHGKAVLVEKPMAVSVAECDAMIDAANRSGAVLAVGLMRRFIRAHQFAHSLITKGALGRIESFDFREGFIYNWPVTSDFFFRKEAAGGGVLIDTGSHTLDSLFHWLGNFLEVEYFDDADGGVEANCLLNLRLQSGARGVVELSRTRRLRNTAIIRGERGTLEVALSRNQIQLFTPDLPYVLGGAVDEHPGSAKNQGYSELYNSEVEDFIAAIERGAQPSINGTSARSSIELIEACYLRKKPLDLSWAQFDTNIGDHCHGSK